MIAKLNRLKEKRGSMAIEIIIGCFIFLIVLCFLMDLTVLAWRYNVVSQTNTYLARTVGIQGGISPIMPMGFPGNNSSYITTAEALAAIQENFSRAGIQTGQYTVKVNGIELRSGTTIAVDYRDYLTTEIETRYEWTMISNFIPGVVRNDMRSKRSVMSEFKYRYDYWIGE